MKNSGRSDYSEISTFFPVMWMVNFLQKEQKNEMFLVGSLMGKEMEKLDDHRCLKVHDLVKEEKWACSS